MRIEPGGAPRLHHLRIRPGLVGQIGPPSRADLRNKSGWERVGSLAGRGFPVDHFTASTRRSLSVARCASAANPRNGRAPVFRRAPNRSRNSANTSFT